jgi:N-acetylmuramic acid 6-phosphate etherase
MARAGYVSSNLMVNLILKNRKLEQRGIAILETLAKVDRETAMNTLDKAGMKLPAALVMLRAGVSRAEAARRLKRTKGNVRKAIEG